MPLPGGASDKYGNRFEGKWTAYCIAQVMAEEAESICLEPPGSEGEGCEFTLLKGPSIEYHQVKRQHSRSGEWGIAWWHALPSAPSSEDRMMNQWAPFIARHLAREKVLTLDEKTFVEVFSKVHAFRNYADRAKYTTLGLQKKLPEMSSEDRGEYLARRLYGEETEEREDMLDLLNYLLYGGATSNLPERLFEVAFNPVRRIRHAGLSTFGEIVGWALPTEFPPRNGRTSKALFALGYDVTIHTE